MGAFVVLHDSEVQTTIRSHRYSTLHDRRFPSSVATPNANNPDYSQLWRFLKASIFIDGRRARTEVETGPNQPTNPEDCRDDTRADCTETGPDHPEDSEDLRGTTSCAETVQINQRSRRPWRLHRSAQRARQDQARSDAKEASWTHEVIGQRAFQNECAGTHLV